jgi:HEAT repeat protein
LGHAVPVIIDNLQSTNESMASLAASVLGHFNVEPEVCVPALSNEALSATYWIRESSINALGEFGRAAMPALDVISNALFDSDIRIRQVATNAVLKIAPEMLGTNASKVK